MLIAVAVLLGLLAACALGGDPSRLADLRFRGTRLVFAALAVQLAVFTPWSPTLPDAAQVSLHLASYALLLVFLALNIRLPGLWVAAAGFSCNFLVIAANGGRMPVSPGAWSASVGTAPSSAGVIQDNVALAGSDTRLSWLGDILPVPVHPVANALSIGDLLLIVGITAFVYRACRPEPPARAARPDLHAPASSLGERNS